MIDYSKIKELLLAKDDYLILIHKNPDGDALGSAEALRLLLRFWGKKARILSADPLPRFLRFLPKEELFPLKKNQPLPAEYTYLAVDVAEKQLCGFEKGAIPGGVYLKIDHHKTGSDFAAHNFVDPSAAAAGEILYELSKNEGIEDPAFFESCYVAIATDTGCFRYSNTTKRTFLAASELLEKGVDTKRLNAALFESKDPLLVKANALGILNARFYFEGRVALLFFENETCRQHGLESGHLAELSSVLREIDGVELSVVLKEKSDAPGHYRLSARSKHFFDCASFCGLFGGGGHARAAGAELSVAHVKEATKALLEAISKQMEDSSLSTGSPFND